MARDPQGMRVFFCFEVREVAGLRRGRSSLVPPLRGWFSFPIHPSVYAPGQRISLVAGLLTFCDAVGFLYGLHSFAASRLDELESVVMGYDIRNVVMGLRWTLTSGMGRSFFGRW